MMVSHPANELANKIELHLKLDETPGYILTAEDQRLIVDCLRKAALATQQDGAWQPIETAPKDGEVVLVFGRWAGETAGPDKEPAIYMARYCGKSDYEGFEWTCVDTDAYAAWVKPTHWRPVPAGPARVEQNVPRRTE